MTTTLTASALPLPLLRRGKVREVYEVDDIRLLLQSPSGTTVALMANAGGDTDLAPGSVLTFADGGVALTDAGAIVTFLGTVRQESRGRAVLHLDYEAYGGMAVDRLSRIAAEAVREKGALRAAILHRVGRLPVGGDSVMIAVAAAHRAEAFEACRHVIEALKADVPIWKKEVFEEGDAWVGWGS